jgi:HSP20 family protein
MRMYSYDQVLTDVKDVYEQLTGLPAPEIDIRKPRYPLPKGVNPVSLVQSEIDHLNMYLINSGISGQLSKTPMWTPPAEVYETQDAYVINLELPGMSQEDVNVSHANNILTVRGARRFKKASEESRYHTSERSYGTFERLFPLPGNAQTEKIKSKLTTGILQITIPKIKSESSGRSGD